jgi:perosamine synthetase
MTLSSTLSSEFTTWLKSSLNHVDSPNKDNPMVLHEPWFCGNENRYVSDCIETGWVSSAGAYVTRFEKELAQVFGTTFAIATVNGTAALHLCLELLGINETHEVLLPALTFIASANAVAYTNATPHFVESCPITLGVDPKALEQYLETIGEITEHGFRNKQTGKIIKALIVVHIFGHPANMAELKRVCDKFNIEIIEDAAESIGSFIGDKSTGGFGKLAATSFNGNKTITCGGGGAILTNDEGLARRAKHLTTTAKLPHAWEFRHDEIGYNYRMPNINAALGCGQLEQLSSKLKAKRELFLRYQNAFKDLKGAKLFSEPMNCQSNYWLQTLLLDEIESKYRDDLLLATNNSGIMTRPVWVLLNELEPFRSSPSMELTNVKLLSQRIINIPSSPSLVLRAK